MQTLQQVPGAKLESAYGINQKRQTQKVGRLAVMDIDTWVRSSGQG